MISLQLLHNIGEYIMRDIVSQFAIINNIFIISN